MEVRYSCVCVVDEPWNGAPAICGLVWASERELWSSVRWGDSAAAPLFLLSCRTGTIWQAKDQCHMSIFGRRRRRCQTSALQLFSKMRRAIDDNEEGHFN